MTKRTIAALVLIETDDPLLDPETATVETAGEAARLRQAVLRSLPGVTRVVLVTDEDRARTMCMVHFELMQLAGMGKSIHQPPPGYVTPKSE